MKLAIGFLVTFSCDACDKKQTMKFAPGDFSREWVENWIGFIDGSSKFYVTPPTEDSLIGRCASCGARALKVTLDELFNPDDETRGRQCFAAYADHVGGLTHDRKRIPEWSALTPAVRAGWIVGAFAVLAIDELKKADKVASCNPSDPSKN